jgi:hypothetical protein
MRIAKNSWWLYTSARPLMSDDDMPCFRSAYSVEDIFERLFFIAIKS